MSIIQRYISLGLSVFLTLAGVYFLKRNGWFNAEVIYLIAAGLAFIDAALYSISILLPYDKSRLLRYLYLLFITANLIVTITDQVGLPDILFFVINVFLVYLFIKQYYESNG